MNAPLKRKLAIGTTVLAGVAFAGGAYAATSVSGPNGRQAFLNDVAKRLNVTPTQLQNALQGAFFDQLQAAVTAGRLTQAQADAIKKRVQQGGGPFGFGGAGHLKGGFFGAGPGFFKGGPGLAPGPGPWPGPGGPGGSRGPLPRLGFAPGGRLSAAASYLGLNETQLLDQLRAGKSLAQIASSKGKSVSGLKAALTAAIKAQLDKAVSAKMLTSAQEQKILSELSARLSAEINGTGFARPGSPGGQWHGRLRTYPAYPVPPTSPPQPIGQPSGPVY